VFIWLEAPDQASDTQSAGDRPMSIALEELRHHAVRLGGLQLIAGVWTSGVTWAKASGRLRGPSSADRRRETPRGGSCGSQAVP
jgi:hypothetical protein